MGPGTGVAAPYDAVLLVSFGGPEGPADVMAFLRRVTAGRDVPDERLAVVAEHYHQVGGRSPINDQNRALLAAVRGDLARHGVDLPVYWGNRNWDPLLADVMAEMTADGVRRVACFVTSGYPSYSGCRQYREDLFDAVQATGQRLGTGVPRLDKLRHYADAPGFVEPFVDGVVAALERLPDGGAGARLVFVTHSVPTSMDAASGRHAGDGRGGAYVRRHCDVAVAVVRQVTERTGTTHGHDLVFCSRSGPPGVPWLEPDVGDHLEGLAARDVPGVVVVPIGFVSDHMEVIYDLDIEAREVADRLGLAMQRVSTPGTDARFVALVRELLLERAATERGEDPARPVLGRLGPSWDVCPAGCCANPRGERPALCGVDSPEPAVVVP